MKKLTQEFVENLIREKGGRLLSKYTNNRTKIKIECLSDGYVWNSSINLISLGSWCPQCSGHIKITTDHVACFISSKNGKLLSPYIKSDEHLTVKCLKDSYIWHPTWNDLKSGTWCPKCAGKILLTLDELKTFINNKCGVILNIPKNFNGESHVKIKCLKDRHVWSPTYNNLINKNSWCPKCSGFILKTFDEVRNFVLGKKGVLLSKPNDLINNKSRLNILCENNHEWEVSYSNLIYNNRWCSHCKNKTQTKLVKIMKSLFPLLNIKVNQYPFHWLRDRSRLQIDIWIPDLKLAIEYDGKQHYDPVSFGGIVQDAQDKFICQKKKDRLKSKLIKQHKDDIKYFIHFNYKEDITKN